MERCNFQVPSQIGPLDIDTQNLLNYAETIQKYTSSNRIEDLSVEEMLNLARESLLDDIELAFLEARIKINFLPKRLNAKKFIFDKF